MSKPSTRPVQLRINRVTMSEMPAGGERRLHEALQRELSALFSNGAQSSDVRDLRAPLSRTEGAVARQIAQKVQERMKRR
jgi:hypothetical protein